jgi:hypothetical protein
MSDVGTRIFPMRIEGNVSVNAVGCQGGGLKEGARHVAKGKGVIPLASSLEPRACCEAVIQFTGGTL